MNSQAKYYNNIDKQISKAFNMIVDDLSEQTVPGQLQEIFEQSLRNLPSNHASLLKKEELIQSIFKSALTQHMKIHDNITRPDTRSLFEKITESAAAATESFKTAYAHKTT